MIYRSKSTLHAYFLEQLLACLGGESTIVLVGLELAVHEVVGEVILAHYLVLRQLLRQSLEQYSPLEEQVGTVGDRESFLHVVVGNQDADIAVFQSPNDVLDVLHGNRVNAGERLIKEDELRVDCQCAGDFTAAAFSSGKLDAKTLADFVEVELTDE